jgi:hypothetical protein
VRSQPPESAWQWAEGAIRQNFLDIEITGNGADTTVDQR